LQENDDTPSFRTSVYKSLKFLSALYQSLSPLPLSSKPPSIVRKKYRSTSVARLWART